MRTTRKLCVLTAVVGAILAVLASTASAGLQKLGTVATPAGLQNVLDVANAMAPVTVDQLTTSAQYDLMPKGISTVSAKAAWSQYNSRAFIDPNLRQLMQQQMNVTNYNPNDYRVLGYGKASPDTSNSSVLNNGAVVPARNSTHCFVGAQVLIVVSKSTGAKLEICTACGNPRLRRVIQQIPKRPWKLGTVLSFQKRVSKPVTCPNGKRVGRLNVLVLGTVHGRTFGTLRGSMRAQMRLQINLVVQAKVKLKCVVPRPSKPKPVPTPTAAPCSVNGVTIINSPGTQIITCPNFWVFCGNVALGPYSSITQTNTVVCSNKGTTPVVVNCNCTSPPPPPSTPCVPPNVMVNGVCLTPKSVAPDVCPATFPGLKVVPPHYQVVGNQCIADGGDPPASPAGAGGSQSDGQGGSGQGGSGEQGDPGDPT
jgi:hypothetical protein